jgi:ribosomal protein S20
MPNTTSAKKALRQNQTAYIRNKSSISKMKTLKRKVRESIDSGNIEQSNTLLREYHKYGMSLARKGLTTLNRISADVSKFFHKIKSLTQASTQ